MKYTEEEMHELEILAHLEEKDFDHNTCDNSFINLVMNAGKKAFEIINKQKKEINVKDKEINILDEAYSGAIKESKKWFDISKNSVSKETIKNKIKELQEELKKCEELDLGVIRQEEILVLKQKIKVLKELLGDE